MDEKLCTLISFAIKAGKAAIGRSAVISAISRKKVSLIIITNDASHKTIKEFQHKNKIRIFKFFDKTELGAVTGREETAALGICEAQFAKAIIMLLPPEAEIKDL